MRHVVVDEWSRGASVLHRRDARAKLAALLLILVAVALSQAPNRLVLFVAACLIAAGVISAGLPARPFLVRTAAVLPIALVFAAVTAIGGHADRAAMLLLKSWLSAAAVLVLVATTPLPRVLHALRSIGTPALLVETVQFVYRYLFVLAEQAWRMRNAAASRGGARSLGAAAGTVTVLFARSYARAEAIHRAMLSRGYSGELPLPAQPRLSPADYTFVAAVVALLVLAALPGVTS